MKTLCLKCQPLMLKFSLNIDWMMHYKLILDTIITLSVRYRFNFENLIVSDYSRSLHRKQVYGIVLLEPSSFVFKKSEKSIKSRCASELLDSLEIISC